MKSGIIIQARTGSQRLPNKMLLPFFEDKGIFEIILQRLSQSSIDIPVIVATTANRSDDKLAQLAIRYGFEVFRGDEKNVLSRFIEAASHFRIGNIVRLCADNPFIDINALEYQIRNFDNSYDYWCFCNSESKPTIKTGYGFWTEMTTLETLNKIASATQDPLYLEHVTNYIYAHSESFNIHFEKIDARIEEVPDMRLTVDTYNDFILLKEIYSTLISNRIPFDALKISNFVKERPEWLETMRAEGQKNIK